MQQLTPNLLSKAITLSAKLDKPLMIWSSPGIGKSSIINQLAQDNADVIVDIRLANFDAVDMRGVPSVSKNQTVWNPPAILPFIGNPAFDNDKSGPKSGKTIWLFMDEIMQAMPAVQSVAFQLVLDRRCGEHALLPNVRIVAASNRQVDRGGAHRMATPLANRFTHVELVPSLDDWCSYAFVKGLDALPIAFLRFKPDLLNTFDPSKADVAFATPRSWETACEIVSEFPKVSQSADAANLRWVLLSGTIGEGVATELEAFMRVWEDMPSIDGILMDPTNAPVPTRPDVLYSTCAALASRCTKGNFGQLVEYSARLPQEFSMLLIKDAIRREPKANMTAAFSKWAVANAGVWQE
jgi:hypothetical protein